jgi:hypothetical protein
MATYVNDLRLKEIGTGESSGTWGTETNVNLELIGEAMGYGTEAITTNADTHASTVADGSTDAARSMYIKYTGTLDSACTITIGPNTMSRVHIIENATSGSQNIIIKQGSGAEVTIANGFAKAVYLDGAGSGAAVTEAFADLSVGGNLLIDGATPTLTIGDAGAEDTKIVFDGNAQDFYIGLDDSADDLVFGKGSTLGTTQAMAIDENMDVAFGPTTNVTITNDGNEDTLQLISTDTDANAGPVLDFNRPVTGADDDVLGKITFSAQDDSNNAVDYAYIETHIKDASDTAEDGLVDFQVMSAGTSRSFLILNGGGTVIVNQDSQDIDFRVESNNNTHMLFVDAGSDHVNFGTSTDHGGVVNIESTDNNNSLVLVSTDGDASFGPRLKLFRNSGSAADGDAIGFMNFTGTNDAGTPEEIGYAAFDARIVDASDGTEDGRLEIVTILAGVEGTSRILMDATETSFNDNSANLDFRVEGNGDTHALFVNAGADVVSFGGMQSDVRYFSGLIPKLQADATTRMNASIGLTCNSNDTLSPMIMFGKTRGAALNGTTVAAAGDAIGSIVFNPSDGTADLNAMGHTAAAIDAVVESGIGTNDVPAALRFYTNPGGESSSERARITGGGLVFIGKTVSSLAETGIEFHPSGIGYFTSTDTAQAYFNRENTNGVQLQGRLDNSNVWSISTNANSLASDRNFKKDITDLQLGLDFVKKLKPKTFRFKMDKETDPLMTGLIAQDLEQSLTDAGVEKNSMTLVQHEPTEDESQSQYMVDYSKLIPVLIKGMQEQQALIETLEAKVKALEEA